MCFCMIKDGNMLSKRSVLNTPNNSVFPHQIFFKVVERNYFFMSAGAGVSIQPSLHYSAGFPQNMVRLSS